MATTITITEETKRNSKGIKRKKGLGFVSY